MALVIKVLTDYDLGNMITLMLLLELNVIIFLYRAPGSPSRLPSLCLHEPSDGRGEEEPAPGHQKQVGTRENQAWCGPEMSLTYRQPLLMVV